MKDVWTDGHQQNKAAGHRQGLKERHGLHGGAKCNRDLKCVKKFCGVSRWYRAAVVLRWWSRRLIPETRVRFLVVTHLLTSLNLTVSTLAPE